jgi:hypothetical protein
MLTMFGNGILIIGLTRENITRLTDDKPIAYMPPSPRSMPVRRFYILFGETKLELVAQLEAIGVTLPEELKVEVQKDPT